MTVPNADSDLNRTALYDLHVAAQARMVPFAGYAMPVQYEGIKAEHLHTRAGAGLFDVSHMGQVLVSGERAALGLERLLPVDLEALAIDQLCYTFFTAPNGGLLDDLIVTRRSDSEFMLVVNAGCKHADIDYLRNNLPELEVEYFDQQALLALQGPRAEAALAAVFADLAAPLASLAFMQGLGARLEIDGQADPVDIYISRSGYTGEDGFEISLPNSFAEQFARELLLQADVRWCGLGARDSLRLEAGLCLYGHDIDPHTTPIEAGLAWSIDKTRRAGASKAGGFPGADIIFAQLERGAPKKRVGFRVDGRVPVREGAELVDASGAVIGRVSSGGFAPSLQASVLMAYVDSAALAGDRESPLALQALVRGKPQPLSRCKMPFVAHNYKRDSR